MFAPDPNNFNSNFQTLLNNYETISRIRPNETLCKDSKGNLQIESSNKDGASSLSRAITYLSGTSMMESKENWQAIAERISQLNQEAKKLLSEYNKRDALGDLSPEKIDKLKEKLKESLIGFSHLSRTYENQSRDHTVKKAFESLIKDIQGTIELYSESHLDVIAELPLIPLIREVLQNAPDKVSVETLLKWKGELNKVLKEKEAIPSPSGPTKEEIGLLKQLLHKTNEQTRKNLEFEIDSQIRTIDSSLQKEPQKISLATLVEWRDSLKQQILIHTVIRNIALIDRCLSDIDKEIEQRRFLLTSFEGQFHEFNKRLPEAVLSLVSNLDYRLLNEDSVIEYLKKCSAETIQLAEDVLKSEGKKDEEMMRGAMLVLHAELKKELSKVVKNSQIPLEQERVAALERLSNLIRKADRMLVPDRRDLNTQTSLAIAHRYLAKHYRAQGSYDESFKKLIEVGQIQIMGKHPLGNLQEVDKQAKSKGVAWLQSGDTSIRHRQIRTAHKILEGTKGRSEFLDLSFTINREARAELEDHFKYLIKTADVDLPFEITEEKVRYPQYDFRKGVYLSDFKEGEFVEVGNALNFKTKDGRITVSLGSEIEKWNQYQKVSVQAHHSVDAQELHAFLSLLGLPTVLMHSRPEDTYNERIARTYAYLHPQNMLEIDSPEKCLAVVDQIDRGAEIKERAKRMQLKDVGEGRMEYVDPKAVEDFLKAGGCGFGTTLGHMGVNLSLLTPIQGLYKIRPIEESANTLALILKGGQLSSMERFEKGIVGGGCCPEENVETGSANQVFVRPLTKSQFENQHDWGKYAIEGNIFLLLDPTAAERLPYSYPRDRAGLRNPHHRSKKTIRMAQKEWPERGLHGGLIKQRRTLDEIAAMQEKNSQAPLPTAEVMFESVLSSQYIYGAVVQSEADKKVVIETLKKSGIDFIAGKPIEEAIYVGKLANEMMKPVKM